jgi:hypothetical protein
MKNIIILLSGMLVFTGCTWFGGGEEIPEGEVISYCANVSADRLAALNKYCPYYADFRECECATWDRNAGVRVVSKSGAGADSKNFYDYSNGGDYSYYYDESTGMIRRGGYGGSSYLANSLRDVYVNERLAYMTGARRVNQLRVDTVSREGYVEYNKGAVGVAEGYLEQSAGGEARTETYLGRYGDRGEQPESYVAVNDATGSAFEGYVKQGDTSGVVRNETFTNYYGDAYRDFEGYVDKNDHYPRLEEGYLDSYGDKKIEYEGYLDERQFYTGADLGGDYLSKYDGGPIWREEGYSSRYASDVSRVEEYTVLKGARPVLRVESYL